jgi:hypothetical protein
MDLRIRVENLLNAYHHSKKIRKKYPNLNLPSLDLYAEKIICKSQNSLLADLSNGAIGDIHTGNYGEFLEDKLPDFQREGTDYGYILFKESAIFTVIDSYESTLDSLENLDLLFVLLLNSKIVSSQPTFLKVPLDFYAIVESLTLSYDLPRAHSSLYLDEPEVSVREVMDLLENEPDSLFSSLDYCINFLKVFSI